MKDFKMAPRTRIELASADLEAAILPIELARYCAVPPAGCEPARLSSPDFESGLSTNYNMKANIIIILTNNLQKLENQPF